MASATVGDEVEARQGPPAAPGCDARSGEKGRGGWAEQVLGGGAMEQGRGVRDGSGQRRR
jgi:hypothetical protein